MTPMTPADFRSQLQEVIAFPVTPFRSDLSLDIEGLEGNLRKLVVQGPADLAAALGYLADPKHPKVQAALAEGCTRCRSAGKAAGILTSDPDDATRYFEWGFAFVAVGSDVGVLARGGERLVSQCRRGACSGQ